MIKVCVDLSVKDSPETTFFICEFAALPRVGERIQMLGATLQVLTITHYPVSIFEKGERKNLPNDWSVHLKVIVV